MLADHATLHTMTGRSCSYLNHGPQAPLTDRIDYTVRLVASGRSYYEYSDFFEDCRRHLVRFKRFNHSVNTPKRNPWHLGHGRWVPRMWSRALCSLISCCQALECYQNVFRIFIPGYRMLGYLRMFRDSGLDKVCMFPEGWLVLVGVGKLDRTLECISFHSLRDPLQCLLTYDWLILPYSLVWDFTTFYNPDMAYFVCLRTRLGYL